MNYCQNCGSKVNPGEAFCRMCGTKLPTPDNNIQQPQLINNNPNFGQPQQINNPAINKPVTNFDNPNIDIQAVAQNYNDEEALIDAYIGNDADKLKNRGFSICTFVFVYNYLLYRKMWLIGFVWLAIYAGTSIFLSTISPIINLIARIFIAIKFKDWYLKHVEEEVAKIKNENSGKSSEELIAICRKKGGVTFIPLIVSILIYLVIAFIRLDTFSSYLNTNNGNSYNNISTTSETIGKLNVKIPSILTQTIVSTDYYKRYDTDSKTSKDLCSLTLNSTNNSNNTNSAKEYLEKNIYYPTNSNHSEITEKYINGKTWAYAHVTTSYSQTYYYVAIDNGTFYQVRFAITSDENGTCSKAHNTVVDSLRIN